MVHWLKFNFADKEAFKLLKEYADKYDCEMTRYYSDTNLFYDYVKLNCKQNYNDLDLDCNSFSSPIYHLQRKPSNLTLGRVQMQEAFNKYVV